MQLAVVGCGGLDVHIAGRSTHLDLIFILKCQVKFKKNQILIKYKTALK
jgi:hypothetical protein